MYFFKNKSQSLKERISKKKEEVFLYQTIIEESLKYLNVKIDESE